MPQYQVSDHAIIRYLQRSIGLDVERIRRRLLTPEIEMALELGVAKVSCPVDDKCEMVLRDNVIVTIQPKKGAH